MSRTPAVLYDGWALAYEPGSWEALHLQALMANLPVTIQPQVALPADPFEPLPTHVQGLVQPVDNNSWGRLRWEQRILPGLASSNRSDLQHLVGVRAALFASGTQVISPAGYDALPESRLGRDQTGYQEAARPGSLTDRLRLALGQGGFSRAAGLFWPDDLPDPNVDLSLFKLPPLVHPRFAATLQETALPDLPETYILYHGPQTDASLHRLVEAWSWATGSIGEYYPLLVLGFDRSGINRLNRLLEQTVLTKTVSLLPPLSLDATIYLYQNCTAVFHPAGIPAWGGPLRSALVCGRPLVAFETPLSDALVGPAGYLVNPDKPDANRSMGAALITVIVEESVATGLARAAQRRSAAWESTAFSTALEAAYLSLLSKKVGR